MAAPVSQINQNGSLGPLITEIAKELSLETECYSDGWVISVTRGEETKFITFYTFPSNNSTSAKACTDKAITSEILKKKKIPHIPHRLALNPAFIWAPKDVKEQIQEYAKKKNYNLVLKPKEGTGGMNVIRVHKPADLDDQVATLFNKQLDIVLSPFKPILREFRVIVLKLKPELIYEKVIPTIQGDGVSTQSSLIKCYLEQLDPKHKEKLLRNIDPEILASSNVLKTDESVPLLWKHNLGLGAFCKLLGGEVLEEKLEYPSELVDLALKTVRVLDAHFVSVDIVELLHEPNEEKRFRVMEVNSGVMMKNLMSEHGEKGVEIAKKIYTKALQAMFQGP